MNLVEGRQRLYEAAGARSSIERALGEASNREAELEQAIVVDDVALGIVHQVRDLSTVRVQQTVSELCSEGLRVVFDDPDVRLEVRAVERRGVVEADLVLIRGGIETDPLEGNGGGLVADIAATLRLVLVRLLGQRGLAQLLVLDEPFAALSADRREAMGETLREVARQLGVQVLTVTHDQAYAELGDVYEVRWADREAMRAEVVKR